MIERAALGQLASGWQGTSRKRRWRPNSWLGRLVAALSRAGDTEPTAHAGSSFAAVSTGAQRDETPRAADPRTQVAALYEQHARAVLGYLCARLPTLDDAEDALAEVFVAALAQCAASQSPGLGWLLTVARRRAADFYRHRHVTQSYTAAAATTFMAIGDGPEGVALRAEAVHEALARVAALPDDQRDALALRFAAGLRAPQIAAVLGKSDEATRALLSRALRRLRKELAQ